MTHERLGGAFESEIGLGECGVWVDEERVYILVTSEGEEEDGKRGEELSVETEPCELHFRMRKLEKEIHDLEPWSEFSYE